MSKGFWGVIIAIVLIIGGVMYFSKDDSASKGTVTNHVMGTSKNSVTLTEYGDYQCPACGQYYPIVKEVADKYKDRITFQFRNLPLSQIHQNAFAGARAAEAAAKQDKFWEMHDMLYETQKSWSSSSNPKSYFDAYAKQLGLDTTKFDTDFASSTVNDSINADIEAFNKTGETKQTPSFFLNGKAIDPGASVEEFAKLIDNALANK